ncbi:MAG: hypothetical protein R3Y29_00350 [bacterium]
MAIPNIALLANLSLSASHKLLLEEGYILQDTVLEDDEVYEKKFIDTYYLFNQQGEKLDAIYYIEYCNKVPDDNNYIDGRTTLEAVRAKWQKNNSYIYIF